MLNRIAAILSAVSFVVFSASAQTELLPNGNFTQGDAGWNLNASLAGNNGGDGTYDVSTGQYVITINAAGYAEYAIQMSDTGLTILKGHTYHIHIDAKASEARPFTYGVGMTNNPWTTFSGVNYVGEMNGQLGTDSTAIDTTFTMTSDDNIDSARIFLNFGQNPSWPQISAGETVTVMHVSLLDMGGNPDAVRNGKSLAAAKQSSLSVNGKGFQVGAISSTASLKVFSLQGALVADLSKQARQSSMVAWSATGLKAGTYVLRLLDNGKQIARQAVVPR